MGLPPLVRAFHAVIHRNEYALTCFFHWWAPMLAGMLTELLTRHKTGQAFRPGLSVVELPGIEPAQENALNWGNAGSDGRESTSDDAKTPGKTWQVLTASTDMQDS